MFTSLNDLHPYLATCAELLSADGINDAVELMATADSRIEETGYDNWNGGTKIFTIYLSILPTDFSKIGSKREQIEEHINKRLKTVLETHTSDWYAVKIVPRVGSGKTKLAVM